MSSQLPTLDLALPSLPPGLPAARWAPVRTLQARHRPRVLAHLLALSEDDRRLRFGYAASDERIQRYVAGLDFDAGVLLGIFNRRLQLVALAHLALMAEAADGETIAEFAVSVSEHTRGRGFGSLLLEHAIRHARQRGCTRLVIQLARDNQAMQAMVRRVGAELQHEGSDSLASLPLPGATLGSWAQALIEEQAAELDYRLKARVLCLRPAPLAGR